MNTRLRTRQILLLKYLKSLIYNRVAELRDTKYPDYEFDCTLLKSRKVWPEGHHNLDIIAGYCGYDLKNHHLVVTK